MRRLHTVVLASSLLAGSTSALAQSLDPAVRNDLSITMVASRLTGPTAARFLPDGRLVVIEQNCNFVVIPSGGGNAIAAGTVPCDFDGAERGLLGLAIDPEFATSNRLYFYYSAQGVAAENRNRVAYATIDPNTSIVDVAGRQDILTGIYGPRNHDGGGLEFGPDGNLYIGAGDTGCNCGCAPGQADNYFGTCLTNMNGKIMRIDREGAIPPTNPLVGVASVAACGATSAMGSNGCNHEPTMAMTGAPRQEIYAWGFRNPWRFSFDSQTGWLWIGDVGEVTWEEITISKMPGEHHGWPFREGFHGQAGTVCQTSTPQAAGACVEPVFEYNHNEDPNGSASVTGGVFSNDCSWPAPYRGRYWFADYVFNRIWTLTPNATRDGVDGGRTLIATNASSPVHFFVGNDGAIYYVSIDSGYVARIGPKTPAMCGGMDAGFADAMQVDGNPPGMDATAATDTGITPSDATTADASSGGRDATASADSGGGGGGMSSSGCGCSTAEGASGSIAGLLILGAIFALRRRGQR